jgi:ribosomal protein RSM22 (predicted rRNA methylase)
MWSFPAELEEALWAAARALLPAGALSPSALAAGIVERSKRYTTERGRLGAPVPARERARDLAARALFFGVADAAKVAVPLAELAARRLVPARSPLRVLDVGAGAGAMSLGAHAALPGRALEVLAVDRDPEALALLARAAAGRFAVRTLAADVTAALPEGRHELVLLGTVVNELPAAARVPLVRRLLDAHVADDGALVIVEPALRETARALHELRDELIAGGAHVFAPCTRRGAPCPALADERDWCHEDRPFASPPRLAQLARATGLRLGGLKFAYLTLRRAPAVQAEGRALRVVSDALDQKGTIERILCGDEGRARRRILRREKGPSRDALADSRRGDVLVESDGLELSAPSKD